MIATAKKQYSQDWIYCVPLAKHAWRFYLLKPDATVDNMTDATRDAWVACYVVWGDLSETERAIVRTYHTFKGGAEGQGNAMKTKANTLGIQNNDAWKILRKAWQEWAIKRGLADRTSNGGDANNGNVL